MDTHFFRTLWFALAIGFLTLAAAVFGGPPQRYVIESDESLLQVSGTSTIHDWTCNASEVIGFVQADGDAATALSAISEVRVTVPVRSLDCGSGTMERKLRDALQADDYAEVQYELEAADLAAASAGETFDIQARGRLTLAGQTKPIAMTVEGTRLEDGRMRFTGSVPLTMSTYGIDPPTAMLGTLKTGDRVEVAFNVIAGPTGGN